MFTPHIRNCLRTPHPLGWPHPPPPAPCFLPALYFCIGQSYREWVKPILISTSSRLLSTIQPPHHTPATLAMSLLIQDIPLPSCPCPLAPLPLVPQLPLQPLQWPGGLLATLCMSIDCLAYVNQCPIPTHFDDDPVTPSFPLCLIAPQLPLQPLQRPGAPQAAAAAGAGLAPKPSLPPQQQQGLNRPVLPPPPGAPPAAAAAGGITAVRPQPLELQPQPLTRPGTQGLIGGLGGFAKVMSC
jgi:hypothetical protein